VEYIVTVIADKLADRELSRDEVASLLMRLAHGLRNNSEKEIRTLYSEMAQRHWNTVLTVETAGE
jgi:hypothetical protein